MTEQLPELRPPEKISRKTIFFGILGLCLLLAAVIFFYAYLYKNNMFPGSTVLTTPTQTVTLPAETVQPENGLNRAPLPQASWTPSPTRQSSPTRLFNSDQPAATEIPVATEPPVPTPPYTIDVTPVFSACQYTLKPGMNDFLYSIYWQWGVYQKYPILDDFYAGISCAGLPGNTACTYQAVDPDTTMPGWTLVLPGVTPNTCLAHGGTPVP